MLSKKLQRVLVVCIAAGLMVGISSVAYAQEEPPAEEAEPVVVDEEGTRPLPRDDERPVPTPGPDDPASDIVIAPAPDGVVEPAPAPTGDETVISPVDQTVISPGGETIGIEDDEGFPWAVAGGIAAAVVAAVLVGLLIGRSIRTHRGHPLPH